MSGHPELVLETSIVISSRQVSQGTSQLQSWWDGLSLVGVLLRETRGNSVEDLLEEVWCHPQVVEVHLRVFYSELLDEVMPIANRQPSVWSQ